MKFLYVHLIDIYSKGKSSMAIKEPEDKYNIVSYIFILLGIGVLLPWNAVLTALDFFAMNYSDYDPYFVFGLTLNAPAFAFNFVGIFAPKYISLKIRMLVSIFTILSLQVVMPFVAEYMNQKTGWIITMLIIVVMGIASSFFQGGVFGFAGMFPFKYTAGVMFGNGISGLTVNVLRMICLGIFPPSNDPNDKSDFYGCLIYFSIAAVILVVCAFAFIYVENTELAKFYTEKAKNQQPNPTNNERTQLLDAMNSSDSHSVKEINQSMLTSRTADTSMISKNSAKPSSFFEVYRKIMSMALQVFFCFLITFVVFPGTSLSTQFDFLGTSAKAQSWFLVLIITVFNIFDTIGRFLGGPYQFFTPRTLFILTVSRLIFIPLLVLIQLSATPHGIFKSDWFRIVNMALFAFTNGYNSTLAMIFGPSLVGNADKEVAGIIMSFHLIGGIFAGSLIASFAMVNVPTY